MSGPVDLWALAQRKVEDAYEDGYRVATYAGVNFPEGYVIVDVLRDDGTTERREVFDVETEQAANDLAIVLDTISDEREYGVLR